MVAVTYGVARVPAAEAAPKAASKTGPKAAPRKSWFSHFIDVLIEARMMQAQREIRMQTRMMPFTLDESGNKIVRTDSGDMPLGGW
ncbi:MAG TPA: hypothetical protein VGF02_10175 [Pseudolabrys sp.]|jgi:hypothetical protein